MSLAIEKQAQADERDEDGGDEISQLPEPILHYILSLLSQRDAVRTCVLSKSWRYLWRSRPVIDFRESYFLLPCYCFHGHSYCKTCYLRTKQTFLFVLDKTLQRYHDLNLSVHELRLDMDMFIHHSERISLLLKWIPKFTIPDMCLITLNLSLHRYGSKHFDLPLIFYESESLQRLYLKGCKLSQINEVLFKRLQTLSLNDVDITKETLEMILSTNPLLESVSLVNCKGFKTIRVRKLNRLKEIAIDGMDNPWLSREDPVSIEIDIPTIEKITVISYWFHHHSYLPHLTFLCLKGAGLTKSVDFLSGNYLPCLQHLTLELCYLPEEFSLHLSGSVKHLCFINAMGPPLKASFNAPNIAMFVYEGKISPSSIYFTTTSTEWKSEITINGIANMGGNDSLWFGKLRELLEEFSQSEISFNLNQHRSFGENWRTKDDDYRSHLFEFLLADISRKLGNEHKPVIEVEHFSLWGDYSYSSLSAFLNCLFCVFRPRCIEQYLYFSIDETHRKRATELTEFLMHMFLIKEKNKSSDWPRGLKQVTMVEDFDKHAQGLDWMKACFQLEWGDS